MANQTDGEKKARKPQDPPVEVNSVGDISAYIEDISNVSSESSAAARSFTNNTGFKSIAPLHRVPSATLACMIGACAFALAEQVDAGTDGASDHLNLALEYATDVGTLKQNMRKVNTYIIPACDILGIKEDIDSMTPARKTEIVVQFIQGQKGSTPDKAFMDWAKAQVG